ncbi:MAG TPA: class I SAM-dependent methyltransferase [Anaerolineales bacterium]|nr:class I SAM-dependent methyltransferase [Anaerolineales bacterium]
MIILYMYWFFVFLFSLGVLWVLVPALFGPPSRPTGHDRIRKALKLVNLQAGETLYDLGAGDGRVLLIAAREFDANTVGIEIGPVQCALIGLRIAASGFGNKIQLKWGNYFNADVSKADVVFVYATSREILRLARHLEGQMKPGARVVSISADFPEWEPSLFDEEDLIFVYSMPPAYGSLTTYLLKRTI